MNKHRIRRNLVYRAYMRFKAFCAALWFGFPSRQLICYGITGTDGKSTTSEIAYHIMKNAGVAVGLLSTVSIAIGSEKHSNDTKLTSLSHRQFQKLLRNAVKNGLTHMVIEVSSHALYQWRVWPIKFHGVGFTNLSREHLDFHWSMDHYFETKFRLFREYAHPESIGIIPDGFAFGGLAEELSRVKSLQRFGYTKNSTIRVDQITNTPQLGFMVHFGENSAQITTQLLGAFNAENMMIAAVLADHAGVSRDGLVTGLESFPGLPGRQELVVSKNGVAAMIDFALTPDALTTLYKSVRKLGFKKQIAVFGATGNRDKGKRALMGTVAVRYNDFVIITEDENYHENGIKIMKAVEEGIDAVLYKNRCMLVQDRKEAILYGLSIAQPGDILIVTGMANFTSRMMNEGAIPWDEKAIIKECMEQLGI